MLLQYRDGNGRLFPPPALKAEVLLPPARCMGGRVSIWALLAEINKYHVAPPKNLNQITTGKQVSVKPFQ